jgi:hypothetical protein
MMGNGIVSVESVVWRSGEVDELVAPSVCETKSTGSILDEAMRGPSNPRTTR